MKKWKQTAIYGIIAVITLALAFTACPNGDNTGSKTYSYTVTFDKNYEDDDGGTYYDSKVVKSPAKTVGELPEDPTRQGYVFDGWNTKDDGSGTDFTATTPVTKKITVYARWTKVENFTVTFNKNNTDAGGTNANPATKRVSYPEETTIDALPAPPMRPGYTFAGWNTKADGTGDAFTAETPVTETFTVYARWNRNAGLPVISVQPVGGKYTRDENGAVTPATKTPLSVTAALPDETPAGTLSHQWYYSTVSATDTGTAIPDAESATYDLANLNLATAELGSYYYYVKVTNTNNSAPGDIKTASLDSSRAVIKLSGPPIEYTVSGGGASITATGGKLTNAAGTMTQIITAIQTDADGNDVEIEFATTSAVTATAGFSGDLWGEITLKGTITSDLTGSETGTVTIGGGVSVKIVGSIANTNATNGTTAGTVGKAVYISGESNVEIANGANLTAVGGNALYHAGSGTVIISGGTLTSANQSGAGTGSTYSAGTVCCTGNTANLTISGGTVKNTNTTNGFGVWMNSVDTTTTMLTISGGTIDIVGTRAVAIIYSTSVTLEGAGPTILNNKVMYVSNGGPNPWGNGKFIIGSTFNPPTGTTYNLGFNASAHPDTGTLIVEGGAPHVDIFKKIEGSLAATAFTVTGNNLTY
jgi:uncharacterized repeat protein (TIGR02543 family)